MYGGPVHVFRNVMYSVAVETRPCDVPSCSRFCFPLALAQGSGFPNEAILYCPSEADNRHAKCSNADIIAFSRCTEAWCLDRDLRWSQICGKTTSSEIKTTHCRFFKKGS
jgi:hypothetical protein